MLQPSVPIGEGRGDKEARQRQCSARGGNAITAIRARYSTAQGGRVWWGAPIDGEESDLERRLVQHHREKVYDRVGDGA